MNYEVDLTGKTEQRTAINRFPDRLLRIFHQNFDVTLICFPKLNSNLEREREDSFFRFRS